MNRAKNTRERIIDKASQLMLQHGVDGFSYKDISEPLGVKNAAIHYHFPSKNDLVKALIEDNHTYLRKATAEFMAYGGPTHPQIEGMFRFTLSQCHCGRPVCMGGSLSVNYDGLDDDIKKRFDRFMKDTHAWLTKVLETGREQNELDFKGKAAAKATVILATIQGSRQMARIHGIELLESVFEQIRVDIGMRG